MSKVAGYRGFRLVEEMSRVANYSCVVTDRKAW